LLNPFSALDATGNGERRANPVRIIDVPRGDLIKVEHADRMQLLDAFRPDPLDPG